MARRRRGLGAGPISEGHAGTVAAVVGGAVLLWLLLRPKGAASGAGAGSSAGAALPEYVAGGDMNTGYSKYMDDVNKAAVEATKEAQNPTVTMPPGAAAAVVAVADTDRDQLDANPSSTGPATTQVLLKPLTRTSRAKGILTANLKAKAKAKIAAVTAPARIVNGQALSVTRAVQDAKEKKQKQDSGIFNIGQQYLGMDQQKGF